MLQKLPLDILEASVELLLPFFLALFHEFEILAHLGKLLAEQLGSLLVLLDCGLLTHLRFKSYKIESSLTL